MFFRAAQDSANNTVSNFAGQVFVAAGFPDAMPLHFGFEEGDFSLWTPLNASAQPGPYRLDPFDVSGSGNNSLAFGISAKKGADGVQLSVFLPGPRRYYLSSFLAQILVDGWGNGGSVGHLVVNDADVAVAAFGDIYVHQIQRTNIFGSYDVPFSAQQTISLLFDKGWFLEFTPLLTYADDVVISPVRFRPLWTDNFTNGTWSGTLTCPDPATNLTIKLEDNESHREPACPSMFGR